MDGIDLTSTQRRILRTLVDRSGSVGEPIQSADLAADLDREPQTVRNRMQGLKDLGLVESITGPRGGYQPTRLAYDLLDRSDSGVSESVVLARDYDRVAATVAEIAFTNVHHPDTCGAHIQFREAVGTVAPGDAIVVGPTPVGNLAVAGVVEAVDERDDAIYVDVTRLDAPVADEG